MPCQVYMPEESKMMREKQDRFEDQRRKDWFSSADVLTHMLDEAREELIAGRCVNGKAMRKIEELSEEVKEISHREPSDGLILVDRFMPKETDRLLRETEDVVTADKQMLNKGKMLKTVGKKINKSQEQHRKEDLVRVIRHFADKFDFEEVARAASCDVSQPLIPQLGYDPDDLD